jgi:double zinc ribbon protein
MRCSSCGSENREGQKFCAACGVGLTLACGACGANNQPRERFRGDCGESLATRESEAALAEAGAWLEMSAAKSYAPVLHVERAKLACLIGDETARQRELREAHRLFAEMGATAHVERVVRELA